MTTMHADPAHLLKALQPAVSPGATAPARPPLDARPFDALLAEAGTGAIRSDRPVRAAATLDPPLTPAQLDRLAAAADRAEAAGARSVLTLLDGRGLVLDVATRSVTAELTGAGSPVVRVDAAMSLGADDAPRPVFLAGLTPPADVLAAVDAARSAATDS
jgi:hypothetical protein